jgi:outer membrane protein W
MIQKKLIMIVIIVLSFCCIYSEGQGVTRSSGIGVKIGFWNIGKFPTHISSSNYGKDETINISGAGTSLLFFSRMTNNWFLELNLGIYASAKDKVENYIETEVDVTGVIPLLFGLRYDILSNRLPSVMKPYLSLGVGPYWISQTKTDNEFFEDNTEVQSNLKYGGYLGGGMNLLITSWFALNFDLKYNFVDFKFKAGYSGLEFSAGTTFMWGRAQEIIQVKGITLIVNDIYPAYYQFYNTYPLALVSVKNVAGYTIEVNVKSNIRPYSERTSESGFIRIEKGKTKEIPITAIFGKQLQQIQQREPAVLDIEVEARAGKIVKKEMSAQLTIHTRNSWNGEMDKLNFFITSDDEELLQLTRTMINKHESDPNSEASKFKNAESIFDELCTLGINYHADPTIPFYKDDRVQYAKETLKLKSGDCDDLTILYTSLLQSIGISTAFVEVRDPGKQMAHVYLLFDTGLTPDKGYLISSNEKRFVIRRDINNHDSIWIPIETTLIGQDFETAWKTAATSYLQEGVLRNGVVDGWVKIIDVE